MEGFKALDDYTIPKIDHSPSKIFDALPEQDR